MKIAFSNILRAFDSGCVGTRVLGKSEFMEALEGAISKYQFPENGQGFIPMPEAAKFVSPGDAPREGLKEKDYVVREWRGEIGIYARRTKELPGASFCAAIVYTKAAYLADPEVTPKEAEEVSAADYVLVAVLGSCGPKPTLSSHRFVRNLAGGNAAFVPTLNPEKDLDLLVRLVSQAQEIAEYEKKWVTVSD
jgi:hypothetical protein